MPAIPTPTPAALAWHADNPDLPEPADDGPAQRTLF
jgi:hypothetical protein